MKKSPATIRVIFIFVLSSCISLLSPHADAARSEEAHYKRIKEYEAMLSSAPEANTRMFIIDKGINYLVGTLFASTQISDIDLGISNSYAVKYNESIRAALEPLQSTEDVVRYLVKLSVELMPHEGPLPLLQLLLEGLRLHYENLVARSYRKISSVDNRLSQLARSDAREAVLTAGIRYVLGAYMDSDLNIHETTTSFTPDASKLSIQLRSRLKALSSITEIARQLTELSIKIQPLEGKLPILNVVLDELHNSYERSKTTCATALNSAQAN